MHTTVIDGHGVDHLENLVLHDSSTGRTRTVSAAALFILIGAQPHTEWLPRTVERDDKGFILTGEDLSRHRPGESARTSLPLETSLPGVFAAGDVRHGSVNGWPPRSARGALASGPSTDTSPRCEPMGFDCEKAGRTTACMTANALRWSRTRRVEEHGGVMIDRKPFRLSALLLVVGFILYVIRVVARAQVWPIRRSVRLAERHAPCRWIGRSPNPTGWASVLGRVGPVSGPHRDAGAPGGIRTPDLLMIGLTMNDPRRPAPIRPPQ